MRQKPVGAAASAGVWISTFAVLFVAAICSTPVDARAQEASKRDSGMTTKPNIGCIVADDLGWKDMGFHGSDIRTPNTDKLAEGGVRLDQFYAQPMCTPTAGIAHW